MQVRVLNRQRKYRTSANELRDFSEQLAPLVLKIARAELPEQILVVLVSDRKISAIHEQFMGVAGPTDVITFQHGEIVVSVETAAKQATEYDTDLLHEVRLISRTDYCTSPDTTTILRTISARWPSCRVSWWQGSRGIPKVISDWAGPPITNHQSRPASPLLLLNGQDQR